MMPNSKLILTLLIFSHLLIICISNVLVQYPIQCLGYQTTWGALSYPIIFILTDLNVRLYSKKFAQKIMLYTLIPGLICSYGLSLYMTQSRIMSLRIAGACFIAYFFGQLLDIYLFRKFMNIFKWWFPPLISGCIGNITDTFIFFFIACYRCPNPLLAQSWPEIAMVDLCFKIAISIIGLLPIYGLITKQLQD